MEFDKFCYIGVVQKLSNWGYRYNKRLLKIDSNTLSYYRDVPKNFTGS